MRARSEVHEVIMDLSSELRGLPDREVPMDTRVADITPVSSGVGRQLDIPSLSDRAA